MKSLLLTLALAFSAQAQPDLRNSATFSGGFALGNPRACCDTDTAVSLGATYGYRPFRHLQFEAGVMTALHPTPEIRGATFTIEPTDRFTWVPVGLRGILPLRSDRIELSAGGGGVYEHYSAGNIPAIVGLQSQNAWGGYFVVGAAGAIGRGRHFWLGASAREFLGSATRTGDHDRWFAATGDLSFRF